MIHIPFGRCESFSSFSVAEECMKQEDVQVSNLSSSDTDQDQWVVLQASPGKKRSKSISDEEGMAGVELLAQAIDSVIMRVQVGIPVI